MLNKLTIIGRLGSDPETRFTGGGKAVANFSVATDYTFKNANDEKVKETTWHHLVLWGKLAEIAQAYLHKGDLAYFEGRIQNRSFEDKQGQNRTVTEVVVSELKMLQTRGTDENVSSSAKQERRPAPRAPQAQAPRPPSAAQKSQQEIDDEDIPF